VIEVLVRDRIARHQLLETSDELIQIELVGPERRDMAEEVEHGRQIAAAQRGHGGTYGERRIGTTCEGLHSHAKG
jgi:hypothetical protein